MKRIHLFIIAALLMASCSESFLDTAPLTTKVDVNFYQTPADADLALTAAYAVIPLISPANSLYLTSEVMSDDRFSGGGVNDRSIIATEDFKVSGEDQYLDAWTQYYKGIFRTNMLISKLDQVKWSNANQRGNVEGQAHFLRAYFYFDLARMFGQVPLLTETAPLNLPKAEPDAIWAQIATDFKLAIEAFPDTKIGAVPTEYLGHATKWAAEGFMARAFLFYTGFYGKTEMPLVDGSTIKKEQVVAWIDDCIANSGHQLMPDFRNLWPYSYCNKEYGYAKDNNLKWYGEDGSNIESVFEVHFSNLAGWSTSIFYSNQMCLYQGWRNQTQVPFGNGWGMGCVNSQLWDSWDDADIRKRGSICDVTDPNEGISGFVTGGDKQVQETGYWSKKYMPINVTNAAGKIINMSVELYGCQDNFQLNNTQDQVVLRYADILLMGAELGGGKAQSYLDLVRSRVGLPSVTANLENIKKERRYELAFEGVRYYDLMRWKDLENALAAVKDVPVWNEGSVSKHTTVYRPETKGFLPIPNSQILLSDGVLIQNEGWTGSNYLFN